MTFLDFFAGIGGMRRGLELNGHTCVGFCEIDKYAVASYTSMHLITETQRDYLTTLPLRKRQNEILKEEYRNGEWWAGDITKVKATELPKADIWCFGSPCTSFSLAGRRKGLEGESGLILEVFRLLENTEEKDKPEWLIYENVKGMFSSNGGFDFLAILLKMDELGYDVEWQLVNSRDFGIPQNRERVYTIGHYRGKGRKSILPIGETNESRIERTDRLKDFCKRINKNAKHQQDTVQSVNGVCKCIPAGTHSSTPHLLKTVIPIDIDLPKQDGMVCISGKDIACIKDDGLVYILWSDEINQWVLIRRLTAKECFRLQGWNDTYYEKARFVNVEGQLYKQAGNGVSVCITKELGVKL